MVGVGGLLVVLVGLAHDDLVVAEAEGVAVHGHRVQVDVRVGALGLAGRGAIVVPDGKLWKQRGILFKTKCRDLFYEDDSQLGYVSMRIMN